MASARWLLLLLRLLRQPGLWVLQLLVTPAAAGLLLLLPWRLARPWQVLLQLWLAAALPVVTAAAAALLLVALQVCLQALLPYRLALRAHQTSMHPTYHQQVWVRLQLLRLVALQLLLVRLLQVLPLPAAVAAVVPAAAVVAQLVVAAAAAALAAAAPAAAAAPVLLPRQ